MIHAAVDYCLYSFQNPLTPQMSDHYLPVSRDILHDPKTSSIRVKDYFSAISKFLEKDHCKHLHTALGQYSAGKMSPDDVQKLSICLVKHGEFYHPAHIIVSSIDFRCSFVINVALSQIGNRFIRKEFDVLKRLNEAYPHSYIPKVYAYDDVATENGFHAGLFIAEWFDGFCEFHISDDQNDKERRIIVWDEENGNFYLSKSDAIELYRQASMILTRYYNFETFEQIRCWHHAAGDFVFRQNSDGIGVKLITVRDYSPMVKAENDELESVLEALLLFFLNLTLQMRQDRLNGTGEIVWADEASLRGIIRGFFDGLENHPQRELFDNSPAKFFRRYMASVPKEALLIKCRDFFQNDFVGVRANLERHIEHVINAIY